MTLFKYLNNDAKHSPFFSEEEIFVEGKIDQVLIIIIDSVAVQMINETAICNSVLVFFIHFVNLELG